MSKSQETKPPAEATNKLVFDIGMRVDATDRRWGMLDDIVVDPTRWVVTHLVVQPRFRHHKARLVPVEAVSECTTHLQLSLSSEQIVALPQVEVTDFIRYAGTRSGNSRALSSNERPLTWPYYPVVGPNTFRSYGYGYGRGIGYGHGAPAVTTTTYDHLPNGTVEIRRNSEVVSVDHHVVGHVDGFVTDTDGAITHLVLRHGHVWGYREITIPLADIAHASYDEVRLRLTRDEVEKGRAVSFER